MSCPSKTSLVLLCALFLFFFAIEASSQKSSFTGYATAFLQKNEISYASSGYKDKENKILYDSLTIQPIGSVSKIVIGLALVKAEEMGFINLDSNINNYLPFVVKNPKSTKDNIITLRHLATHTSGILDHFIFYRQAYVKNTKISPESLHDYLISYLTSSGSRYSRLNFGKYGAGSQYNYSNIGAALAAYIIENASKMPFHEFTDRYIFKPLGMTYTHWFYSDTFLPEYAHLYKNGKLLRPYALTTYPDGALKSNVLDLSKLMKELMNGFNGNGAVVNTLVWQRFYFKNFDGSKVVKGLNASEPNCGIFIVYSKNGAIGHTGADPGVSTVWFFDPIKMEGKIFLANEQLKKNKMENFKSIWLNISNNKGL